MLTLTSLENAIQELEKGKRRIIDRIQKATWGKYAPPQEIPAESLILEDLCRVLPARKRLPSDVESQYQQWYSACRVIVEKNQPSRLRDFDDAYLPSKKEPDCCIKQFLLNQYITKDQQSILINLINSQLAIVAAVPAHVRFSLYDIELTAYSVLSDDEIDASRHLFSKGFLRSAGALAGVVLERHLKMLLTKHSPPIKYGKQDTLSKLNDLCKEYIYDITTWRKVQLLTDLRNLCDHDKGREPTKGEVCDLIDGVSATLKSHTAPVV